MNPCLQLYPPHSSLYTSPSLFPPCSLTITLEELQAALTRKGITPVNLDFVLSEMEADGEVISSDSLDSALRSKSHSRIRELFFLSLFFCFKICHCQLFIFRTASLTVIVLTLARFSSLQEKLEAGWEIPSSRLCFRRRESFQVGLFLRDTFLNSIPHAPRFTLSIQQADGRQLTDLLLTSNVNHHNLHPEPETNFAVTKALNQISDRFHQRITAQITNRTDSIKPLEEIQAKVRLQLDNGFLFICVFCRGCCFQWAYTVPTMSYPLFIPSYSTTRVYQRMNSPWSFET